MTFLRLLAFALFALLCAPRLCAQGAGGRVAFRISEVSSGLVKGIRETIWLATHETKGAKAQFLIAMQLTQTQGGSTPSIGKGYFAHVPGSQPKALLKQLAVALAAQKPRFSKLRVKTLPFDLAVLGTGLARGKDGGFSSSSGGSWIATKVFLANDAGEVFLNLDLKTGVGEFSIKDEDYGDVVVNEMSKVL